MMHRPELWVVVGLSVASVVAELAMRWFVERQIRRIVGDRMEHHE
jgi:hypothetical protein